MKMIRVLGMIVTPQFIADVVVRAGATVEVIRELCKMSKLELVERKMTLKDQPKTFMGFQVVEDTSLPPGVVKVRLPFDHDALQHIDSLRNAAQDFLSPCSGKYEFKCRYDGPGFERALDTCPKCASVGFRHASCPNCGAPAWDVPVTNDNTLCPICGSLANWGHTVDCPVQILDDVIQHQPV